MPVGDRDIVVVFVLAQWVVLASQEPRPLVSEEPRPLAGEEPRSMGSTEGRSAWVPLGVSTGEAGPGGKVRVVVSGVVGESDGLVTGCRYGVGPDGQLVCSDERRAQQAQLDVGLGLALSPSALLLGGVVGGHAW